MKPIQAVRWSDDGHAVRIVDQRQLPDAVIERDLRSIDEVCEAIRTLAVRGAPAIGIAAAMGLTAALASSRDTSVTDFLHTAAAYGRRIRDARPTAVNLPWAIDRMLRVARQDTPRTSEAIWQALHSEATAIWDEDRQMCRRIGEHGRDLVADGACVLTHCNAGALATGGVGTALAPVYMAAEAGRQIEVLVGETRPLLQGSRLTAWELARAGIPVTVVTDNAVPAMMRSGLVDLCLVGADRIAVNGDVANKIGTYGIAIAAHHHGIPFYVAAPTSTFDPSTPSGDLIEVEERTPDEVRHFAGRAAAPHDVAVRNPAFDVTPASLVSAIISDRGVHRPPFDFGVPSETDRR